jgi:hypothetical protein
MITTLYKEDNILISKIRISGLFSLNINVKRTVYLAVYVVKTLYN